MQAAGPGRRRCRRGLQDAFGAVRPEGCRKRARSEPGCFSTRPSLPRNGSPRERASPRESGKARGRREGENRERKSFSLITTSLPYLQYKEKQNSALISSWNSTGTEKRQDSKRKDIEAFFFFFFLMEVKANLKSPNLFNLYMQFSNRYQTFSSLCLELVTSVKNKLGTPGH